MPIVLLILNTIASLGAIGAGCMAVARPGIMLRHTPHPSARFYAQMYAARAIPLGAAAGLTPYLASGWPVAIIVVAAGVAQLGDVLIGLVRREWGMVFGPLVAALIHGLVAVVCIVG